MPTMMADSRFLDLSLSITGSVHIENCLLSPLTLTGSVRSPLTLGKHRD